MKYLPLVVLIVGSATVCSADERSAILQTLSLELKRCQSQLKMPNFEPPYFISFRLIEQRRLDVEASFGAVVDDDTSHVRRAAVDVRVGDYAFDSSPETEDLDMGSIGEFTPSKDVPLDNDSPLAIRAVYWGLADAAYKDALSTYLRKKARAVNKVKRSKVDSLTRQLARQHQGPKLSIAADRVQWKALVRRLSKAFRAGPTLLEGTVGLSANHVRMYLVNTEGTQVVEERTVYSFVIRATTRAPDGLLLEQGKTIYGRSLGELPSEKDMAKTVAQVMKDLSALRKAPVVDPFTGPAILEPEAAGVFFHETIGHRLEGERQNDEEEGQTFRGQLGQSILPQFVSLIDDPTQKQLGGKSLNGHYIYDDQGVEAQRVSLIEKGVLKGFLMSRTPNELMDKSNGHGRAQGTRRPVARMGNLIVEGHAPVSRKRLKEMLIEEARRQNKPYGLIIADITGGSTNTSNYGYQAFKGTPRMVYRVDAQTGEETLVRGVEMVGTPLSSLSKIMATSDETGVFNGYCGAESGYVPVSAAAPAMLFKEIELQRTKRKKRKAPIMMPPWRL